MDFENKYVSELIDIREEARTNKDWKLSDEIRDYLDTKESFVFDTKDGQVIYHELKGMTRDKLIEKINIDKRAYKMFDAWIYSIRSSAGII